MVELKLVVLNGGAAFRLERYTDRFIPASINITCDVHPQRMKATTQESQLYFFLLLKNFRMKVNFLWSRH